MHNQIETERLALRRWEPADAEAALAVFAAPSVTQWLTPDLRNVTTAADLQVRILTWLDEDTARGDGAGHWAVLTRDAAEVVGGLALQYVPAGGANLTLSWALAPTAWGHGYATEAGQALIHWAIHEAGALEVFAIVQESNARAVATAQRMGMEFATNMGGHRFVVYRIRHGDLANSTEVRRGQGLGFPVTPGLAVLSSSETFDAAHRTKEPVMSEIPALRPEFPNLHEMIDAEVMRAEAGGVPSGGLDPELEAYLVRLQALREAVVAMEKYEQSLGEF